MSSQGHSGSPSSSDASHNVLTKDSLPAPSAPKPVLPGSCEPPGPSNPPEAAVWMIFGAHAQLGRALVKTALDRGDHVTAVGRNEDGMLEKMQGWHPECQGIVCDIRSRQSVDSAVSSAMSRWKRIDIIVNSLGYGWWRFPKNVDAGRELTDLRQMNQGIIGATEDQDEQGVLAQFETNVAGVVNILQASAPVLRGQASGRYLIFTSTAGTLGIPGLGPYCASKWAIESLAESFMLEMEGLGIKITLVEPGLAQRDDADDPYADRFDSEAQFFLKRATKPYSTQSSPAEHARRMMAWLRDRQPTGTAKIASIVWELGHCSFPPMRLLLGTHAVDSLRDRLRAIIEEVEDWKYLSNTSEDALAAETITADTAL